MSKASVIIDGRNFYVGWRKTCPTMAIEYSELLDWLVREAQCTERGGVHFVTIDPRHFSLADNAKERIQRVVDALAGCGAEICTVPSRSKDMQCRECNATSTIMVEKQGEAEACVRAIREADEGADTIVFVTSDVDILPIVRELQDNWDVRVMVASWQASPVAAALQSTADRTVLMTESAPFLRSFGVADEADIFVDELQKAQRQFHGGYVGLHYFLTKWRSEHLTPVTEQRSLLLNKLADDQRIEVYIAPDGKKAVRVLEGANV